MIILREHEQLVLALIRELSRSCNVHSKICGTTPVAIWVGPIGGKYSFSRIMLVRQDVENFTIADFLPFWRSDFTTPFTREHELQLFEKYVALAQSAWDEHHKRAA